MSERIFAPVTISALNAEFHILPLPGDQSILLKFRGEDVDFERLPNGIAVLIPIELWAVMKSSPSTAIDFTLTERTDEELRAVVEREVDHRIESYRVVLSEMPKGKSDRRFFRLHGFYSPIYGHGETERARQIENGMTYYREERARIREIRRKTEAAVEANRQAQEDSVEKTALK